LVEPVAPAACSGARAARVVRVACSVAALVVLAALVVGPAALVVLAALAVGPVAELEELAALQEPALEHPACPEAFAPLRTRPSRRPTETGPSPRSTWATSCTASTSESFTPYRCST
jgi:hypothetical protein